jgi:hypothetical protein
VRPSLPKEDFMKEEEKKIIIPKSEEDKVFEGAMTLIGIIISLFTLAAALEIILMVIYTLSSPF